MGCNIIWFTRKHSRLLCTHPHRAEALSDDVRVTSDCRVHRPTSRTERSSKTTIGRGSPRHTWLGHHFQGQNVKGQLAGAGHIVAASRTACWNIKFSMWFYIKCNSVSTESVSLNMLYIRLDKSTSCSISLSQSVHFNGHFSKWTWVSPYRNVSILDFIGAKGDGGGGDSWSYKMSPKVLTVNKWPD